MDLELDFSLIIRVIYFFGAAILAASLLLVLQVMRLRTKAHAEQRHRARFIERWKPILEDPSSTEWLRVHKGDIETFVLLWNELYGALYRQGDASVQHRDHLREIARNVGMLPIALKRVKKGDTAHRLIAITLLGHLGESSTIPLMKELSESLNPIISIAAARSWLQIDATAALEFLRLRLQRSDWPPASVDAIIAEEKQTLAGALIEAITTLPPKEGNRLVRYLALCDPKLATPLVDKILDEGADDFTLVAALKVLAHHASKTETSRAARYLTHENWHVRVQAANALGKMGDASQVDALTRLLSDGQWWVRYRAAQAIAALTHDMDDLEAIHSAQRDRYARDMLTHVIAERALGTQSDEE